MTSFVLESYYVTFSERYLVNISAGIVAQCVFFLVTAEKLYEALYLRSVSPKKSNVLSVIYSSCKGYFSSNVLGNALAGSLLGYPGI